MTFQRLPTPKIQQQYKDLDSPLSMYRQGLDMQRERFKEAKFNRDLEAMADSLENIKSEIKSKMISNNHISELNIIEKIIKDFRTKEIKFSISTPRGTKITYPKHFSILMNEKLTECFELIISELDNLGLLK